MSLLGQFKAISRSVISLVVRAKEGFNVAKQKLSEFGNIKELSNIEKEYLQSEKYHRIKQVIDNLPKNRPVPKLLISETSTLQTKKYKYMFNMGLKFSDGDVEYPQNYSWLSDKNIPPDEILKYLKERMVDDFEERYRGIVGFFDVRFDGLVQRVDI